MKRSSWQLRLGAVLLALSAVLYSVHLLLFRDLRNLAFYTVMDVAFIPVSMLAVTVILSELLAQRERRSLMKKLNMVIGAFYSEVGTALLGAFAEMDEDIEALRARLLPRQDWPDDRFAEAVTAAQSHRPSLEADPSQLEELRTLLLAKRPFLLGLLENPNLLEHESFTNLLWAVFHLTEELAARGDLSASAGADLEHLAGDVARGYQLVVVEWLRYMRHLKSDYPYLYSLALRTNPLDRQARVEVGERA